MVNWAWGAYLWSVQNNIVLRCTHVSNNIDSERLFGVLGSGLGLGLGLRLGLGLHTKQTLKINIVLWRIYLTVNIVLWLYMTHHLNNIVFEEEV